MKFNSKLVLGIIALIAFMLLVFSSPVLLEKTTPEVCVIDGECQHELHLNLLYQLVPIFISIGVIAGVLVFYFMSEKIDKTKKSLKANTDILLKFLNPDEKKVIDLLLKGKGKVLQAELTRLPGMNKVKSHRVVQKLLDKKVIEKQTLGKTRVIAFSKEIEEGLL